MLLWALARLRDELDLELHAAHLDHALDTESGARAAAAEQIADRLDVPFRTERIEGLATAGGGDGLEAAARRRRYEFLDRYRLAAGADRIAVGHHRDDQIETVLLRLLFGSGLAGVAAMRPRSGRLLRPLLGVSREDVARVVAEQGLAAVHDPGNLDLRRPRNLIRHELRPLLEKRGEPISELAHLASTTQRAIDALDERLAREVDLRGGEGHAEIDLAALRRLPESLLPFVLRGLHRLAGAEHPPRSPARSDLRRQLAHGGRVGCDCGDGWRWEASGNRLAVRRVPNDVVDFSYTLRLPGELPIPELNATLRIIEAEQDGWMFEGSRVRAAMSLPLAAGQHVQIRNRRPGDRMRPLGCSHDRKLKDILIDRKIARRDRSALPLVVVGERIAWVPGVTIDDAFRVRPGDRPWVAELHGPDSKNNIPPVRGAERTTP